MEYDYIPEKEDMSHEEYEVFQNYFQSYISVVSRCQKEAIITKKTLLDKGFDTISKPSIPSYKICLERDFLEDDIMQFKSFVQQDSNSSAVDNEKGKHICKEILDKITNEVNLRSIINNPTACEDLSKSNAISEATPNPAEVTCNGDKNQSRSISIPNAQVRNSVVDHSDSDMTFTDAQDGTGILHETFIEKNIFDISDNELIQCAQNVAVYLEYVNSLTSYQLNLLSVRHKTP